MADGVEWFFKLIDQVTAPSRQMQATLGATGAAFKNVDTSIGTTTANSTNAISAMTVAAGGFLADLSEKVLEVGADFLKFGGDLVVQGATFAAQSADFKRNTTFALQTMLGTGADARKTLDELEGYATRTGFAKDDFTKLATRALGAGFGKDELKPLLGAISDIRAANGGDAAAGQALFDTMVTLRDNAKKGINPRELTSLARLGISPDKIYAVIAEQKNVTLAQAKAIAESGGVHGAEALNAVMKTVLAMNQGGKLGGLGEAFQAGSLTAQIQHVKDSIGDLFENVDIKPLTDFLGKLNNGLSGDGIEKIQGLINDAFGGLVGWLDKVSLDDIIDGFWTVADVLGKVWNFGVAVVQVGEAWGTSFGKAFGTFMPAIEKLGSWFTGSDGKSSIDWVKTMVEVFSAMGEGAGATIGFTVAVIEAFALVAVKSFQATKGAVMEAIAIFENLYSIGKNLVEGIWQGITGAWAGMMQRFHSLVELLPAAVKKVLGIASPSRVFADLGLQTARGFTVGLDAGDLGGAMDDAIAPPAPSSVVMGDITARMGSGGGGRAPITINFEINTDGSANGEKAAATMREEMERVVLPSLLTALEQLDVEAGG